MQKRDFSWYDYLPISKAKQPSALFGQPIKNATVIITPKAIPTTIRRLFIIQHKIPKIKSNTPIIQLKLRVDLVYIKKVDPFGSIFFSLTTKC